MCGYTTAEFMKRLAGLSEEDLGDVSQNTSGGETTEDEVKWLWSKHTGPLHAS